MLYGHLYRSSTLLSTLDVTSGVSWQIASRFSEACWGGVVRTVWRWCCSSHVVVSLLPVGFWWSVKISALIVAPGWPLAWILAMLYESQSLGEGEGHGAKSVTSASVCLSQSVNWAFLRMWWNNTGSGECASLASRQWVDKQYCPDQTNENVTLWCRGGDPSWVSNSKHPNSIWLMGLVPSYHGHLINNQLFHVSQWLLHLVLPLKWQVGSYTC